MIDNSLILRTPLGAGQIQARLRQGLLHGVDCDPPQVGLHALVPHDRAQAFAAIEPDRIQIVPFVDGELGLARQVAQALLVVAIGA